jgi:hypothetical protein
MMKYGLIALLYIAEGLVIRPYAYGYIQNSRLTSSTVIHETNQMRRFRVLASLKRPFRHRHQKKLAASFILLVIAFSCLGSFRVAWYYGSSGAKPFGFEKVQPISEFFVHFSGDHPIILTGDAYYMACIFFMTSLLNKSNVAAEPLGVDAITLYYSFEEGNMSDFLERLSERNIQYVLMVEDGRPIYGDAWGYRVILPESSALHESSLNLVHSDGWSKLYKRTQ